MALWCMKLAFLNALQFQQNHPSQQSPLHGGTTRRHIPMEIRNGATRWMDHQGGIQRDGQNAYINPELKGVCCESIFAESIVHSNAFIQAHLARCSLGCWGSNDNIDNNPCFLSSSYASATVVNALQILLHWMPLAIPLTKCLPFQKRK